MKTMEEESLENIKDEEIRGFLHPYWTSIRTYYKPGPIQDLYNFLFCNINLENIHNQIISSQRSRFKINYSFGFVLRNLETHQMRFFHPSFGNASVLPKSTLISDSADLHRFLEGVFDQDFYELVERPNTKWRIVHITNIVFYVNKLLDAPIGPKVELPAYIVNNSGITALNTDDNFCFFRCLSVFRGSIVKDCELDTKQLFQCYIQHFDIDPPSFDGVKLFDFVEIEDLF